MKWVRRALLGSLVLLILALGAAFLLARSSLPLLEGAVQVAGPDGEITVIRDPDGVPHIFAGTEHDAYFALGYVHAQDRLWQMEMNRRLPAGRLAEVVGEAGIRADRFMRTLGIQQIAEKVVAGLPPEVRGALESYTAGVNAWLENRPGALPPEFLLLRFEPEPWRPADAVIWGALMSLNLDGNWRSEILRARLALTLDDDQLATLYPPYPGDGESTLARRDLYRGLDLDGMLDALPPAPPASTASNQWAVSGARTASGAPLIANDPHLGFSAPGLWYLARIEAPGLSLAGATVPGVPFVILGHNGKVGWGFTTTTADTQDVFVEKIDPDDPARYLTPDGSRAFETRRELIKVRGGEEIALEVRRSRHGPIIDEFVKDPEPLAGAADRVLALAATFLGEGNRTPAALYRMNRANDAAAFREALRDWHSPVQNIVFADLAGTIGFHTPGRIPIRRAGDGFLPVPGWTGEFDWIGLVPFEDLPQTENPPGGIIVNANNKVVGPDYEPFISREWEPPYRHRRIDQRLTQKPRLSLDDAADIQADSVSLMARELLPLLLDTVEPSPETEAALDRLRGWDGTMRRTLPEPLLFTAWLVSLSQRLFGDELGESYGRYLRLRPLVIRRMLSGDGHWCDNVGTAAETESCAGQVTAALESAIADLKAEYGDDVDAWRWGDVHQAAFKHRVFDNVPFIPKFANIRIETDGGDYTVNRGTTSVANEEEPFTHVHGAGFRALFDFADLGASRFMQATGQSGHVLSPHYRDLNIRWRDFDYLTLAGSREQLQANGGRMLRITPAATQ